LVFIYITTSTYFYNDYFIHSEDIHESVTEDIREEAQKAPQTLPTDIPPVSPLQTPGKDPCLPEALPITHKLMNYKNSLEWPIRIGFNIQLKHKDKILSIHTTQYVVYSIRTG